MGTLILAFVFLLTVVIGAALAKGVLTLVLNLMVGGQVPSVASIRAIAAGLIGLAR